MALIDVIRARHSVRAFEPRPVERAKLLDVLETARLAPSACNNQPWIFLVVQQAEGLLALAECYPREWFRGAPAVIVCCANTMTAWRRGDGKSHADIDVAIAADHLTLAAAEAGLGTCWVCAFDAAMLKTRLALPAGIEPVVLVPIGYPAPGVQPAERHYQRKPLEETVRWEKM